MASLPSMFGDRPTAPAGLPDTGYIQPNLKHALRIWWALYWRNTLISVVLTFVLGIVVGILTVKGVLSYRLRSVLVQAGSYVLNYAAAVFIMHHIVHKRFREFRIRLTSIGSGDFAQVLRPTRKRTFRIWWTYTWRTVIYLAVLSIAMSVPMGFVVGAVTVMVDSPTLGGIFSQFVHLVIGGAVGLFVMYANILDEDIADFRVSLVPCEAVIQAPSVVAVTATTEAGAPTDTATS